MNHRVLLFMEKPGPRPPDFNCHILPVMENEHTPVFITVIPAVTPEIGFQAEKNRIEETGVHKEIIAVQSYTPYEIPGDIKASPGKTA